MGPLNGGPSGGPSTPTSGTKSKSSGSKSTLHQRQATSQLLLQWDWDRSAGAAQRDPLPREQALAALSDGDPRPLLVLRECENCRGSDDAFLSRTLDNEKTLLLGRWFHAVRLSADVLQPDHPLHELFPGRSPAHLFTVTADGRTRVDLDGGQTQAALWRAMTTVLRKAYREDPGAAVKGLLKLLDQLDEADVRLADAEDRLAAARVERGEESAEVRSLQRVRDDLSAARDKLLLEGRDLDDLGLKAAPTTSED